MAVKKSARPNKKVAEIKDNIIAAHTYARDRDNRIGQNHNFCQSDDTDTVGKQNETVYAYKRSERRALSNAREQAEKSRL